MRTRLTILFALFLAACGAPEPPTTSSTDPPAPARIRLLDVVDRATLELPPTESLKPFNDAWSSPDPVPEGAPEHLVKRIALQSPSTLGDLARIEWRHALYLPPPARFELPLHLAGDYQLRLHLGVMREALDALIDPHATSKAEAAEVAAPPSLDPGGVRFTLAFRDAAGSESILLERELDPELRESDRGWRPVEIDLVPFIGAEGHLVVRTERVGTHSPRGVRLAFVGTPELVAPSPSPHAAEPPLNVLLIGVDTLRADRLSAYGYDRPTSPNLEALATEGTRFERAVAPAPWTLPSFSSLLSSLYPSRHGAGMGGRGDYAALPKDRVILPELFHAAGYRTAALTNNLFFDPRYGMVRGYESYGMPAGSFEAFTSGRLEVGLTDAERVAQFLEEQADAGPFFFFWHLLDPHLPYIERQGISQSFVAEDYDGIFREGVQFDALVQRPGRRRYAHEGAPPIPPMSEEDSAWISDLYDAEVAVTDHAVGRVLEALRDTGLLERTLVVFTADHGEGLADHGHYHHGYTLFEDQIRVPLIVRRPGGPAGEVVAEPVSTVDVAPMILAAAGMAVPEDMQGVDRFDPKNRRRPVFSEAPTYDSSALKAVYVGAEKYLHDPVFGTEAVYRLDDDPAERNNLLETDPEAAAPIAERGRRLLDGFRAANLQGGRYHLRIAVPEDARVTGRLTADEVFDANALLLPVEAGELKLDLPRKHLEIDARGSSGGVELIFWFRGEELEIALEIDGTPLQPTALQLGTEGASEDRSIAVAEIPTLLGEELSTLAPGTALLWLEESGLRPLAVEVDAEERERLRALGYVQ